MSSIVTASNDGPEPNSPSSGSFLEDLFPSFMVRDSFAALSEPEQRKLYQKIRSLLPDAQQSKPSAEGMQEESGSVVDDADDDDNLPVFSDSQYQKDLRRRWMSSATNEQRKNLALEGYRSHWNLGDSIDLPDGVIKNLAACGKQVTAKAGWQTYLQELNCPRKS